MPKLANVKAEDRLAGRYPDQHGHFGPYGGTFIAETLVRPVTELRDAYERYAKDPEFLAEFVLVIGQYLEGLVSSHFIFQLVSLFASFDSDYPTHRAS